MISEWARKLALDRMFAHTPPHLRTEFLERMKAEKEKNQDVSVKAPDNPFLKKKDGDKTTKAKKTDKPVEGIYEIMSAQMGMVSPRPMLVGTTPGVEVVDKPSYSATTSKGGYDNHSHTAYYDESGNGETSVDDTGHTHTVRSFVVADSQSSDGMYSHAHYGSLPRAERTPGSEYKSYDGTLI